MMPPKNTNRSKTGVYAIHSLANSRVYVGATYDSFMTRYQNHLSLLSSGTHTSHDLQQDWDLFGADFFTFDVLECVAREQQSAEFEQRWIDHFSSKGYRCYNIAPASLRAVRSPEDSRPLPPGRWFYTIDEVAAYLMMTPRTIRAEISRGKLRALKAGRCWRISVDAMRSYIETQENMPASSHGPL